MRDVAGGRLDEDALHGGAADKAGGVKLAEACSGGEVGEGDGAGCGNGLRDFEVREGVGGGEEGVVLGVVRGESGWRGWIGED